MTPERMKELGVPQSVERIRSTGAFGHFPGAALASVAHDVYILATPAALAASPEVQALIREAEARGMERALRIMKTAGDSAVTEAMGQRLCCNGQYCGCHGATVEEYLEHLIRAEAAAIRETKHD